jgi:exopolysaccharide biosynthesis polyprenyl glycosylphosphotransferase
VLSRELFFALLRSPRLADRAILLGEGPLAKAVANEIEKRPELGVRLSGYVGETSGASVSLNRLRRLGGLEELVPLVSQARVDRIIVAIDDRRGKLPVTQLLQLKTQGVLIQDGADFYEISTGKVPLQALRPSGLLFCEGFRPAPGTLLCKRAISLMFSALALLLSLPVMLVIALAIRLDSPGPTIFRQPRVGKDGRLFTLFKFRTMYVGADSDGQPRPVQHKDDRITRVGRWLRRCRLDELPQLFNILRGDMYFVGPRPFVPNQEEQLAGQIPFYSQRWVVKPGATGWAQIHRGYNATVEENREKLAYDLFYIKNMSVGLDLLILFQTAKILLLGRGGR